MTMDEENQLTAVSVGSPPSPNAAFFVGFLFFFFSSLFAKLLIAAFTPLAHDEAYYWVWGETPALSYYDHPPFVAWLFSLSHLLALPDWAVRFPAVIFGHITLIAWYIPLSKCLQERNLKWWFTLMILSPLAGLGLIIVTPDLPLMVWWGISFLVFMSCVETPTYFKCFALGITLGLGFCSKYHIVLFVPCAIMGLAWNRQLSILKIERLLCVLIGGLIGSAPVIVWNIQNDWISISYQLHHGLTATAWNSVWPWEYLAGQFFIIFPPVMILALHKPQNATERILTAFAWGPILFFFLTAFRSEVEPNWPIIAYPAIFSLAVRSQRYGFWIRFTSISWGLAIVGILLAISPLSPVSFRQSKLKELYQYDELALAVEHEPDLFASSYQMASQLTYKLRRPVPKLAGIGRIDYYDFRPEAVPQIPKFNYLVHKNSKLKIPKQADQYQLISRRPVTDQFEILQFRRKESGDD